MKISGLIVAAGLSSRMGDFKPLMEIENKPLIINTINSLRKSGIDNITIVVGYRSEDIERLVKDENINIIYNNKYNITSMYDSFKLGLEKIKNNCDAIIFLPGDVGFVSKYTIDLLIKEISKNKSKIAYPMYKNTIGHPPIISSKCFDYLLSYSGENGLKGGMKYFEKDSKKIDTPDKFILYDMDYKEDFYRIKHEFENRQIISYEDCMYLLSYFNVSNSVINHSRKVKEICEDLSNSINKSENDKIKKNINIDLVRSASILHDIKRQEKNHSEVGADLLASLGYYQIAYIVRSHMNLENDMEDVINENTILYYGDKLVIEDKFVDLDKRFQDKLNKYINNKVIQQNIMKKYKISLKIKSNIISIIGINEYKKLENKWKGEKMIYLNNAATSWPKPGCVTSAIKKSLDELPCSAHRSGFEEEENFNCKDLLAKLLKIDNPNNIVYGSNATFALNLAIQGFKFTKGDKILTTAAEHNSVLRPLYYLQKKKIIQYEIIDVNEEGRIDPYLWEEKIKEIKPRMVVFTHASNVTGAINDAKELTAIAKKYNCVVLLDASQSLGLIDVFPQKWNIDMVAFTGHKYILGPQGTGGLYVSPTIKLSPVLQGGTGIYSDEETMPEQMPLRLEAGTPNDVSFKGLEAALRWSFENPINKEKINYLVNKVKKELKKMDVNVIDVSGETTPVISFTMEGYNVNEVGEILQMSFDIICRSGLHCAPLIHKCLKTSPKGTVRISLSRFTTEEEIDYFINSIKDMING